MGCLLEYSTHQSCPDLDLGRLTPPNDKPRLTRDCAFLRAKLHRQTPLNLHAPQVSNQSSCLCFAAEITGCLRLSSASVHVAIADFARALLYGPISSPAYPLTWHHEVVVLFVGPALGSPLPAAVEATMLTTTGAASIEQVRNP